MVIAKIDTYIVDVIVTWLNIDDESSWKLTNKKVFGSKHLYEAIMHCDMMGYQLVDQVMYEVALGYRYFPIRWQKYFESHKKDIKRERSRLLHLAPVLGRI